MTVVFLCQRLADYFYQCISHFASTYHIQAVIITTPADPASPFQLESSEQVTILAVGDRNAEEWRQYIQNLNPAAIYIAGWSGKMYNQIAKHFKPSIPVVMGLDAQWRNTLKQHLGVLATSFMVKPYCNKMWIAGLYQFEFARKLGFEKKDIITGVYSCNTKLLHQQYQTLRTTYVPNKEKTLLYVGRLIELKNLNFLIKTFQTLTEQERNNWKILIVGNGPLKRELQQLAGQNVTFQDFIAPKNLPQLLSQCDAFCLPSYYDQWGVVVHEAAAMGLPLLISEVCGAIASFLIEQYNGFTFSPHQASSLKNSFIQLFQLSDDALIEMGKNSHTLSHRITLETWSASLKGLIPVSPSTL